ncbi:hypothetical protein D1818_05325 [Aquimarina sp. BL5]|uniref:hypothetical protein n=1 Tax=Aquimarina sp. BL5 TaxID=1714860 RepID=UPI000E525171|nr:hypothetical protein [Aquimarina sp. BL5]AXT50277.1 hypothetical protein D1818_05325 [Aquimarina sp. BL5]RKN07153.1 hypothetical protein D7036_07920 [Aquimarina sp. BL5]
MITMNNVYKPFVIVLILLVSSFFNCASTNSYETTSNSVLKSNEDTLSCETNRLSTILIQKEIIGDKLILKLIIKRKNEIIVKKNIEINTSTFGYDSLPDIDLECSSGGFNINYTFSFGNEYILFNHFIGEEDDDNFYIKNVVFYGSNRNSLSIEGTKVLKNTSIHNYEIHKLASLGLKPIYFEDNLQTVNELALKPLVEKLEEKSYFDIIGNEKLLTIITREIPVSKKNLISYNTIENNLKKRELYSETVFLSKIVLQNYQNPQSYLNMGDAYWSLRNEEDARKSYVKYIESMNIREQKTQIPRYILKRLNN